MTNCCVVKVCVLGASSVGKTCIATRFVQDTFAQNAKPTMGAAFLSRFLSAPQGTVYKLQIWDTAGQERYKSLTPLYYRGAAVVLIVYDVTAHKTFNEGARDWLDEVEEKGPKDALLVLVGNKLDIAEEKREVKEIEGKEFADSVGAMFFECSAKSGQYVNDIFLDICTYLENNRKDKFSNLLQTDQKGRKANFLNSYRANMSSSWKFGEGKNDWKRKGTVSLHTQNASQSSSKGVRATNRCCPV